MKKLIFLSAATLLLGIAVNAQNNEVSVKNDIGTLNNQEAVIKKEKKAERKELRKLKGSEVSFQTKEEFYHDFGNVAVTSWERMANLDKATFTKDGQTTFAFYDYSRKLVGTTISKTFTDLPAKAQEYITKKYKDYTIVDVLFFDDNEFNDTDMELYAKEFEAADNYFIELKKDNKGIVLQSTLDGDVYFFKDVN